MARIEIPLLRESEAFVSRLMSAVTTRGLPRYFFQRRVNWTYRYDEDFYDQEVADFLRDPDAYMSGSGGNPAQLSDVRTRRLEAKQVGVVLLKVLSHRLFHVLGKTRNRRVRAAQVGIYRKSYVDDIELVFDQEQDGVLRAVFPFPINVRRQLRYIAYLLRRGRSFKLDGNPYLLADTLRFIRKRDVASLMRLEVRAQIRQARAVLALGIHEIQLSDEFDIGSLDFTRYLARYPVRVINSAHGVGKYYPVHGYREFRVLTNRQKRYYHAIRACEYSLRCLNDTSAMRASCAAELNAQSTKGIVLVVLSQRFGGPHGVIADAERELLDCLRIELGNTEGVRLFYKPHPNRRNVEVVPGFVQLSSLSQVNGRDGTIFVSFFSTSQIDPAFRGKKVLIRSKLIYPEIAFDESEQILGMSELVELVRREVSATSVLAERAVH